VTIKTLPDSTNGLEAILTYCTSNTHDLIVFGHSVVDPTATRVEDGPVDVIPFQSQRTHRSSSIAFSLPAAVDAPGKTLLSDILLLVYLIMLTALTKLTIMFSPLILKSQN
jgi:hypothetical protein